MIRGIWGVSEIGMYLLYAHFNREYDDEPLMVLKVLIGWQSIELVPGAQKEEQTTTPRAW